ncbi:hypothetical protein ABPG75_001686, partial [Micractinium tetrahymenae]
PPCRHWLRTAALVNLAAVLERCDEQMLPAVYRFIGASWGATPTQLGYLTLCRALVQALSSPLGGIAGHCLHRGRVVGAGCLLWAACTAGFAACRGLAAGAAVWAVNGLGLALVLPACQSLVADLFATARGRAFGLLYCTGALGGMMGALYATNMGAHRPLGLEGWRFAFVSLAAVAAAAGVANLIFTEDPLRQQPAAAKAGYKVPSRGSPAAAAAGAPAGSWEEAGGDEGGDSERQPLRWGAAQERGSPRQRPAAASKPGLAAAGRLSTCSSPGSEPCCQAAGQPEQPHGGPQEKELPLRARAQHIGAEVLAVLRIPTFALIVVQASGGIAGSVPWSALVFLTLYLQLCGMSDAQASSLVALFLAGTAVGGLIGGFVGDAAAKRWPNHGRLAVTQARALFSVSIGIPYALLLLKGLPRDGRPSTVATYAAVLLSFALLKAWPAPAFNNPAFAEVTPARQRSLIYAFDRCFEGAVAACAAPLVGKLAQRIFGFSGAGTVTHDRERDLANAAALGNALLAFMVVPWCFTLALYSGLHWTYPADKAAALRRQLSELRERSPGLDEGGAVLIDPCSPGSSPSSVQLSDRPPSESLTAKGAALGARPPPEQLEELQAACAAALAVARSQGQSGAVHQKRLWEAAASLWNASIELGPSGSGDEADEEAPSGGRSSAAAAALLQAACNLCSLLPQGGLPQPQDALNLVRFHHRCGQAWAALGELEAAEAVLSRGTEAAAAHGLPALCFERRGRGPRHQDAAELLFGLMLERLEASLRLGQQVLSSGLMKQAQAFVSDARLLPSEGRAFRLRLIHVLQEQGESLAKAGQPAAAMPLLNTAYECLSQMDLEPDAEDGELAAVAAEAQAMGASVLALLTFCNVEAGEVEQAHQCLQALHQLTDPATDAHFATTFLSLRVLLLLGRAGKAEAELLTIVSHEDATPEGCLASLQAALAAPGGVHMARHALSAVLERFADEPGVAVELARAVLKAAGAAADAQAAPGGGGGDCGSAVADRKAAGEAAAAAEALVLELAGDERLLERVCEEPGLRHELLGMLWNHAVAALHSGRAFDSALAFFSAALPLLESGSGGATQAPEGGTSLEASLSAADCRRAQALCCLGARQFDRALEFLGQADQLQPGGVPTSMLRLSVQLGAGNEAGATAAVATLADCSAAQPDVLRIACMQAVDAGATAAARQALLCLLERCSAAGREAAADGSSGAGSAAAGDLQAPGFEATVFQNLIHLLLADGGDSGSAAGGSETAGAAADGSAPSRHSQLARLFDQMVERMRAVGPEAFFALHEGRPMQQEWFAAQAWNAGQAAGAASELAHSAVLLAVCGEVCAALPTPSIPMLHRQKLAFLMAAASACDVYTEQAAAEAAPAGASEAGAAQQAAEGPGSAPSLSLARSYLRQARVAAAALAAEEGQLGGEGGQQGGDPKSDVFLHLLEFKLAWLAGDTAAQQEALSRARALPAFCAQHFAMAAAWARAGRHAGGQPSCPEVAKAALEGRLQRLTAQAPMDCAAVAETLRSLVELTPDDAGRLHLLAEAAGLLSAEPAGAFPPLEVSWLITTAWNRGAVHARLGRAAEAERFQAWALEALPHADASLAEQHRDKMQAELQKVRGMLGSSAVAAHER